jgi:hypothetical protein
MAMPRSIMVVLAGLSGAFNKTVPRIPSSGTCNHQGMPYRSRIPRRHCGLSLPWSLRGGNLRYILPSSVCWSLLTLSASYSTVLLCVNKTHLLWGCAESFGGTCGDGPGTYDSFRMTFIVDLLGTEITSLEWW